MTTTSSRPGRAHAPRNGQAGTLSVSPSPEAHRTSLHDDLEMALAPWLVARAVVAATLIAAHLITDNAAEPRRSAVGHVRDGLLGWDAGWYEGISVHGYAGLPRVGLRFFPLLPLLARPVAWLLGGDHGWAVVVLANVTALAFGALVHRLCLVETGDPALARRATWLVALTPAAFVLAWGYAESVAGALAVGCFWPSAASGGAGRRPQARWPV